MKRNKSSFGKLAVAAEASALCVGVLCAIFAADVFLGLQLHRFGIQPRTGPGLVGIVFSPVLHANGAHLISNVTGMFFLLVTLFLDKRYKATETIALIWVVSGFGTWLIGRPAIHIGASSVIYGLVAYLICAAFWIRNWRAAFVAMLVMFFYGGIVYGMLPNPGPISWEGHLCGAIAGWWAARHQQS